MRRELRCMAAVVPLFKTRPGLPVSPVLFASDAEGANEEDHGGWGVVMAWAGKALVSRLVEEDIRPGRTIARLDGSVQNLVNRAKEYEAKVSVSRVPRDIDNLDWQVLNHGRWRYPDHIMLGEGRATLYLLEVLASIPGAHAHLVPCLEDNEPWSSAGTKGRSPAGPVNYLLRRRAALQGAALLELPLPWIDTKRQPADTASRIH